MLTFAGPAWRCPCPILAVSCYLLELTAVNSFCFIHHDLGLAMSAKTFRESGGLKVNRDIDIATRINIVFSDPSGM